MQAIVFDQPGDPAVLELAEVPAPQPGPQDLLVRVRATALNRADTLQRRGHYPPPPGESEILGLELAGDVEALGTEVRGWQVGDRVFGLVGGGGYAELGLLDQRLALAIPEDWNYQQAAAVPEVYLTANENVFEIGRLAAGETVLLHAGASGVGTAAIQMAHRLGARVLVTASEAKIPTCLELGADAGIDYRAGDFSERVLELTDGHGVDLILDPIGASYWERNLSCLAVGGRLVLIGLMGGAAVQADLATLLRRRLQITGSVMRSQSIESKAAITERFRQRWWQQLQAGRLRPVIDRSFPLAEAAAAHTFMEENRNVGKILLTVD